MTNQTNFDPKPHSWVRAEFPFGCRGNFANAWYIGKNENGKFMVEFSDDSSHRLVNEIFPFLSPEQMDDEMELKTGCRFGKIETCQNPDCKHNGYLP